MLLFRTHKPQLWFRIMTIKKCIFIDKYFFYFTCNYEQIYGRVVVGLTPTCVIIAYTHYGLRIWYMKIKKIEISGLSHGNCGTGYFLQKLKTCMKER